MSFTDPKAKGATEVGRGNGFDILAVGADGTILSPDSASALGLKWSLPPSYGARFPIWMFGDGTDGSLTLGADTVLAAETPMARYIDLDLNGFSLENAASGIVVIIYVKGTLTLSGGEIRGGFHDAGGAGGSPGGVTAGTGGAGGRGRSGTWVFAKEIVGTGHIHSDGENGADGTAASVNSAVVSRAAGSAGGSNYQSYYLQGIIALTGVGTGGSPGSLPAGGAGGSGAPGIFVNETQSGWRDHLAMIFCVWPITASFTSPIAPANWGRAAGPGVNGSGGGGGNEAEGNTGSGGTGEGAPGGGAGSAAFGVSGNGGNGGDGNDQDAAATSGASSGGAGGGGASGGFVCVLTNSAPSTLTVSADSGAGGIGADGIAAPSGRQSGGAGGGGGGSGGMTIFIAQDGNGATVTAALGVGGAGGAAGGGGATAGSSGVNGADGIVFNLTFN